MTLLSLPGRVTRRYLLRFPGSEVSYDVTGHASSSNVARDIDDLRERARKDAVYRLTYRLNQGGNDIPVGYDIKVIAVLYGDERVTYYNPRGRTVSDDGKRIRYDKDDIITPRRERWKGRYYEVARDEKGRMVSRVKWSQRRQEQDL